MSWSFALEELDGSVELLERLGVEAQRAHRGQEPSSRRRIRASTSLHSIGMTSPRSISVMRRWISAVHSGDSSTASGDRLSLRAATSSSRSASGSARASSRIFRAEDVTPRIVDASSVMRQRARPRERPRRAMRYAWIRQAPLAWCIDPTLRAERRVDDRPVERSRSGQPARSASGAAPQTIRDDQLVRRRSGWRAACTCDMTRGQRREAELRHPGSSRGACDAVRARRRSVTPGRETWSREAG